MHSNGASSESPKLERQLGFYERFRVDLHDLGYYNNVSIIARYTHEASLSGSWPHLIYRAFKHAVHEHPALGVKIIRDANQKLHFQRLRSVNLEEVVKFETISGDSEEQNRKLVEISERENNRGFQNPSGPQWRAVVLRNDNNNHAFHIGFFWHHVIGDGRSGLAVHETLLHALSSLGKEVDCKSNRPSDNGFDFTCVPVSTKPFFVSMEQALPNSTAPKEPVPTVRGEKWTGGRFNFKQPTVTQLEHIRLPAASVNLLQAACLRNNTTITPLLQAVIGKVLLANIDLDRIRTAVAVSLRRFFSPTVDDTVMGLWISTYTTEYHRSFFDQNPGAPSALWQRSRSNTAQINEMIADGGKHVEIMSLMGIDDYPAMLRPKAGQPRDNSFGLTNLGLFKTSASQVREDRPGLVKLDDMVFSQSAHANGAAFTICVVTVQGCDMNLIFNFQEGIVPREKMQEIAGGVRDCLEEIVSDVADVL